MAFTRTAWNNLIKAVNRLISDNGLSATPLEEVVKNHIWSKADVVAVQNKLKEICTNGPEYSVFEKWSHGLIDELEKAISECQCGKFHKVTVATTYSPAGYYANSSYFVVFANPTEAGTYAQSHSYKATIYVGGVAVVKTCTATVTKTCSATGLDKNGNPC